MGARSLRPFLSPLSSQPPSALTLSPWSTRTWLRTRDSLTLCLARLVTKPLPSLGVLAVLLHVSPVLAAVVPTALVRPLSVTCAVAVACSLLPAPGDVGTSRPTRTSAATQLSAVAASALPALVLARGHRIEEVEEVPCVVGDEVQSITKTKEAVNYLKTLAAHNDVSKVRNSVKVRAGGGKSRNRRYTQRTGPLVIYNEDNGLTRAFRNIPGVECCDVRSLNILSLAPGGHLGRFCIWTQGAFAQLDEVFGTFEKPSSVKKDYVLPASKITNADVPRLINSTEIQSIVRPAGPKQTKRPFTQKKNPLRNPAVMARLNPYANALKRQEIKRTQVKAKGVPKKERAQPKAAAGEAFLTQLHS